MDVCFLCAAGSTHVGPLDVKAVRAYERFEQTAHARIIQLCRDPRRARGEPTAVDFDTTISPPHPLRGGSLADTEDLLNLDGGGADEREE